MSNVTGRTEPTVSRLAGEALTAAQMGAVKAADGKIYKAPDTAGYIRTGVIKADAASGAKATLDYGCYWVDNSTTSALAYGNIGGLAYVEDETTVCTAAGASTNLIAGQVLDIDSDYGVLVDFNQKSADTASA